MGGPAVPGPRGSRLPAVQRVPRPGDGDTADQAGQLRHTARPQALLFVTKLEFVILSPIFVLNYQLLQENAQYFSEFSFLFISFKL